MVKEVDRTASIMERGSILMTPGHIYCAYSQQVLQLHLLPFFRNAGKFTFLTGIKK